MKVNNTSRDFPGIFLLNDFSKKVVCKPYRQGAQVQPKVSRLVKKIPYSPLIKSLKYNAFNAFCFAGKYRA